MLNAEALWGRVPAAQMAIGRAAFASKGWARAPRPFVPALHAARPPTCARSMHSSRARRVSIAAKREQATVVATCEEGCAPPGWPHVAIFGSVGPHSLRFERPCA